ncbi:flagellar assembly protein FliW [Colidextribacter sp. OB.20]|uniref:flagellar assembly protein FliW n=1 Tax=Colidextribacter sp. OB.20 TaxID=2304568 RepID=UPI001371E917|nr:flagellar assembly protein FliW [Colidextribacter sp. OB.20]NBI10027.1 flagellar assembly protein FliW [Colidextribacter sp. OB.20]
MRLKTKYFGEIECEQSEELHFPEGLFGFEEEKRFFLLPFEGSGGSLLCFQSALTPELAFVAMNPFSLKPDYAPVLTPAELRTMGVERSEELCFYALCVVRSPVGDSTVNLRCPVAVNDRTGQAMQVILEDGGYHMHHLLSDFGRKEEATC